MEAIIMGKKPSDDCLYFGAGTHFILLSCFSTLYDDALFFSRFWVSIPPSFWDLGVN